MRQNIKFNSSLTGELLTEGKRLLASNKIASPALDATLLLAEVVGLSREELITHSDHKASKSQCWRYAELLERRCRGESIAYILGRKEFWGLEFSVTPAVLVPRPDTETLVEAALTLIHSSLPTHHSPLPILDLCTGCGAVAIALKNECPDLEVWAADISKDALAVACNNADKLGCGINFLQGDLFTALSPEQAVKKRFSLIAANAPYIPSMEIDLLPSEVRNEPRCALDGGPDGLDLIRRIIAEAPMYLEKGGYLALEADPSQMDAIIILMKNSGFSEPVLHKDLAGNNRVIAATFFDLDVS